MARGGARPNSGPKSKPKPALDGRTSADREAAARLIEALNKPPSAREIANPHGEVAGWRSLWEAQDLRVRLDTRKYLYDKRDGKAAQVLRHTGPNDGEPMRMIVEDIGSHGSQH